MRPSNLDPYLAALSALLLALSALAFNACGLGWGEDPGIAEPDCIDDCWEDCAPVYPDAEADGG